MPGISAFGTLLQMEDPGSPGSYLTIAEVKNIQGPGLTLDTLETTTHSSTGAWKEFIGTLLDGGEVTFDVNYVPTNATHGNTSGIISRLRLRAMTNFKLIFPNVGNTTWLFAGLVTAFNPSAPTDDFLGASVTIKLSGQPTLV